MSMHPKHKDVECFGEDLRSYVPENGWIGIELKWLLEAYEKYPDKEKFFIPYFVLKPYLVIFVLNQNHKQNVRT